MRGLKREPTCAAVILIGSAARSAPLMRGLKHRGDQATHQRRRCRRAVCPANEGIETLPGPALHWLPGFGRAVCPANEGIETLGRHIGNQRITGPTSRGLPR